MTRPRVRLLQFAAELEDRDLAGILVAVIAGHRQDRRSIVVSIANSVAVIVGVPIAVLNHGDRHHQIRPTAEVVRVRNAQMPVLLARFVEVHRRMNLSVRHESTPSELS